MITAIDTNVLIDIFLADKHFGQSSATQLRNCLNAGAVLASGVVLVETIPLFPSTAACMQALSQLGIRPQVISMEAFLAAASAWKVYRQSGGLRNRMVADFLIGAHAMTECDRLLTRDRGFYRQYFKKLKVVDPSA